MSRPEGRVDQYGGADEAGHSRLCLVASGFESADALEVSVRRTADPKFLGADGWQEAQAWVDLGEGRRAGAEVEFDIGPAWNAALASQTVAFQLRDPATPSTVSSPGRIAWPGVVLAGATPSPVMPGAKATPAAVSPSPPPPPPEPEPLPPQAPAAGTSTLSDTGERSRVEPVSFKVSSPSGISQPGAGGAPTPAPKKSALPLVLVALVAVGAVGAGAYWFLQQEEPQQDEAVVKAEPEEETPPPAEPDPDNKAEEEPAEEDTPAPTEQATGPTEFTGAAIAAWMQGKPMPDEVNAQGERFASEGHEDLALKLYANAARNGSQPAAMRLAKWLDPASYDAETSPYSEPDPRAAARYFAGPAEAGDALAQYRLGVLTLEGHTNEAEPATRGRQLVEQAAKQGLAPARKYLQSL